MPLRVFGTEGLRLVTNADVGALLKGHPEPLLVAVAEAINEAPDEKLLEPALPFRLTELLRSAAGRQAKISLELSDTALEPIAPEAAAVESPFPVYQLVKPSLAMVTDDPVEIPNAGVTRHFSSYKQAEAAAANLQAPANGALIRLALRKYSVALPPEGDERREVLMTQLTDLALITRAATQFAFREVQPKQRYLALVPGAVPPAVADAIVNFVSQVRPDEAWDLGRLRRLAQAAGFAGQERLETSIDDLGPYYGEIDGRMDESEEARRAAADKLRRGEATGWWLEGERLIDLTPIGSADLKSGAGAHLVIPPWPIPVSAPPGVPIIGPPTLMSSPIVLSLSDFHMGQGEAIDNADEVSVNLERAYVEVIQAWAARVVGHRFIYGFGQPAYLVLNGDHLDFWSADMIPETGPGGANPTNRFRADVANVNGSPQVTVDGARARMDRIIRAHQAFFSAVTDWVDSDPINFVIYVCGNHDDHLVRYSLGQELAVRLHPTRGAFAAESVFFPELRTIMEHGHRKDAYNTPDPRMIGYAGSLGELIVTMLVNPVERGGENVLLEVDGAFAGGNFLEQNGIDGDRVDELRSAYAHMRRCWEVAPRVYNDWIGTIDNLSNGGLEEAVADCGGRELVLRDEDAADAADVSDLDDDLDDLKGLWLSSDYQGITGDLAAGLARVLPPTWQTGIVNAIFAGKQAEQLGFREGIGFQGKSTMRIHVVGHTHKPELTQPPLSGRVVRAQHVNTGTGISTWLAKDTEFPFDTKDVFPPGLAVRGSRDELTAVPKSQYCLLFLAIADQPGVVVEGAEFRNLQFSNPMDARPQRILGAVGPGRSNFVPL